MAMNNIKENINVLKKQRDDKKYERKILATDYEKQKQMVKISGVTALISLLVHYVILLPLTHNTKHVTLMGLGRFLTPFVLLVFLVSFIFFLWKGFDFFVNADTKYSKILAEKFKVNSVSDELRLMNEAITMLDTEIDRLENELYESGADFGIEEKSVKEPEQVKRYRINLVEEEPRPIVEKGKTEQIADKKETHNSSVDDILSGLDEFMLDDGEDDDFESSSDMWEKDAMSRFKKY